MYRGLRDEQSYRERECIHKDSRTGEFYTGNAYVSRLQCLRSEDAVKFAGQVAPFFWSDASRIVVWLCDDCAEELGLLTPTH